MVQTLNSEVKHPIQTDFALKLQKQQATPQKNHNEVLHVTLCVKRGQLPKSYLKHSSLHKKFSRILSVLFHYYFD